ncbi:hypothetical protein PMAYCL1PPCAC_28699, partial [Pristionchus mayeri]
SKFPLPTWEKLSSIDHPVKKTMRVNEQYLDFVEIECRQRWKDSFKSLYPYRYLKAEKGRGRDGYVTNKRALYFNKLMAIEHDFNIVNKGRKQGPVYVRDWTTLEEADESLKDLEYIQWYEFSDEVKELMKKKLQPSLKELKCSSQCNSCTRPKRTADISSCCGMHESLDYCEQMNSLKLIDSDKPCTKSPFMVECTKACGCKAEKCRNRLTQRGRQKALLIFRDHVKEWTLRTLAPFRKNEFITWYCGTVYLSNTRGESQHYDLSLVFDAVRENGEKNPLIVNAFERGNESRFISHSCNPNSYIQPTIVSRKALSVNRAAIHAARNLEIGEEITMDYFGGRSLGDNDLGDVSSMFPEGCKCGSGNCRFTKDLVDNFNKKSRK